MDADVCARPRRGAALTRARHARALEVLRDFEGAAAAVGRVSALAAAARCAGILDDGGPVAGRVRGRARRSTPRMPTPFEQRAHRSSATRERLRRARRRADARARLRKRPGGLRRARRATVVGACSRRSCGRAGRAARPSLDTGRCADASRSSRSRNWWSGARRIATQRRRSSSARRRSSSTSATSIASSRCALRTELVRGYAEKLELSS